MKQTIDELPEDVQDELSEKEHVVGAGIGPKRVDGTGTSEESVVVFVDEKLPEDDLNKTDIVPSTIEIDDREVQTDVQDAGGEFFAQSKGEQKIQGEIRAQEADQLPGAESAQIVGPAQMQTGAGAQPYPGPQVGPAQTRMDKWRPAAAGVSIGHPGITAGTLGTSPLRDEKGRKVFLTNAHVAAPKGKVSQNDPVLQPGRHDGGTSPEDRIGQVVEWSELDENKTNTVDSALVQIDDDLVENDIVGLDDLITFTYSRFNYYHQKSGRTTGVTQGRLLARNVTVFVNYGSPFSKPLKFSGLDAFSAMSQGGDSGSLIGIRTSRGFYGTSLLFAGSSRVTLGCPMRAVLSEHGSLDVLNSRSAASLEEAEETGGVGVGTGAPQDITTQKTGGPRTEFTGSINPGETQQWWNGAFDPKFSISYFVEPLNPGGRVYGYKNGVEMDNNGNYVNHIRITNTGSVPTRFRARIVWDY